MLSHQALLWTPAGAAMCSLFAFGLARALVRSLRRMAASRAWPMTAGEVIGSAFDIPRSHTTGDQPDCAAHIRYRYRVAGNDYESARMWPGGGSIMQRRSAQALVARFPAGAHVDVAYDPNAPENAALEPGNPDDLTMEIMFLVIFAAIATILGANAVAGKVVTTAGGFPLWGFLLPVGMFLGGGAAVAIYMLARRQARAAALWPTVIGKITTSTVEAETLRDDDHDDDDRPSRQTIETRYRTVINYVYRVNGHDYHGTGLTGDWTMLHASPAAAQAVADKYPVGHEVAVYYDPLRPSTAMLKRGKEAVPTPLLVIGAIFLLAGVLLVWFGLSV